MKTTILFLAALFFVSAGFSQVDESDSLEVFQFKINKFRASI